MREKNKLSKLRMPLIICSVFWTIGIVLWQTRERIFYLFNFGFIGSAVGLGIGAYVLLPRKKKPSGRRFAQLLVGLYMLVFVGLINKENMQIEGFFFYVLAGFIAGSVIHYAVAKILGPMLFGRGWCGWACWTAMVLDFLPYKQNKAGRLPETLEKFRYIHFGLSAALVLTFWLFLEYRPERNGDSELLWLLAGNMFYFSFAVVLALKLKDNRAFCKYICPITVILKYTCRFSLLKIGGDKETCTACGACVNACPMDIRITDYIKNGERVLSTECIFCLTCTTVCPEGILKESFKWDVGGKELLRRSLLK